MTTKGCIYYTDFNAASKILEICKEQLRKSFRGEIISVTLGKPLDLGRNIVVYNESRSYPTMVKQILIGLEASTSDYVFFSESDVLYHPSHFDFIPDRDDVYYYNVNNWRWDFPKDRLINYDELTSLSMLCCSRALAIQHYRYRLQVIEEQGLDKVRSREPRWARQFGYEPGTKKKRRGGITDEDHIKRKSMLPNIDIRHNKTFSAPKIKLDSFKHPPTNWREARMDEISGWSLRELFNL
jgi:hypothetical protein